MKAYFIVLPIGLGGVLKTWAIGFYFVLLKKWLH